MAGYKSLDRYLGLHKMSQEKVIEVKNLDKVYRSGTHAVKGIIFEVKKGEFFGMLGPNGAGKRTQLQLMGTLLKITSGDISILGHDIHTDESVDEKISLSDRFGLWIGFHNLDQSIYLDIIKNYCNHYKISYNQDIEKRSIQWSVQRGNRTGRTAWQFIIQLAAEKNLRIDF